jgi:hypothetical protein
MSSVMSNSSTSPTSHSSSVSKERTATTKSSDEKKPASRSSPTNGADSSTQRSSRRTSPNEARDKKSRSSSPSSRSNGASEANSGSSYRSDDKPSDASQFNSLPDALLSGLTPEVLIETLPLQLREELINQCLADPYYCHISNSLRKVFFVNRDTEETTWQLAPDVMNQLKKKIDLRISWEQAQRKKGRRREQTSRSAGASVKRESPSFDSHSRKRQRASNEPSGNGSNDTRQQNTTKHVENQSSIKLERTQPSSSASASSSFTQPTTTAASSTATTGGGDSRTSSASIASEKISITFQNQQYKPISAAQHVALRAKPSSAPNSRQEDVSRVTLQQTLGANELNMLVPPLTSLRRGRAKNTLADDDGGGRAGDDDDDNDDDDNDDDNDNEDGSSSTSEFGLDEVERSAVEAERARRALTRVPRRYAASSVLARLVHLQRIASASPSTSSLSSPPSPPHSSSATLASAAATLFA